MDQVGFVRQDILQTKPLTAQLGKTIVFKTNFFSDAYSEYP